MEGTEDEWRVKEFFLHLDVYNKHSKTMAKGAKHCDSCRFVDRKLRHLRTKMMYRFRNDKEEPIDRGETDILIAEVLRETEDEVIEEEEVVEEVKKGYVLPTPPKRNKKVLREIGNTGGYDNNGYDDSEAVNRNRNGEEWVDPIIRYRSAPEDRYESTDEDDSIKSDKEDGSSSSDLDDNGNESDGDSDKEEEIDDDKKEEVV